MNYNAITALADLQATKAVSPHLSAGASDAAIREAQELDFRNAIGPELYAKLNAEAGGTPSGLWITALAKANLVICYYAIARLMHQHPTMVTRYGVVQKTDESSSRATIDERTRVAQELRATGNAYAQLMLDWMNEAANIATFREYLTISTASPAGIRITSITQNI